MNIRDLFKSKMRPPTRDEIIETIAKDIREKAQEKGYSFHGSNKYIYETIVERYFYTAKSKADNNKEDVILARKRMNFAVRHNIKYSDRNRSFYYTDKDGEEIILSTRHLGGQGSEIDFCAANYYHGIDLDEFMEKFWNSSAGKILREIYK